ncbi:MAG TPA: DNA recombination protein RmuC [Longimicrobiaceae bacterium]|jgi:DNA recombination protein RmuC|nr:DNA recombination protein RmuC [Longimicrobiaceae bacterium]
MPTPIFQIVFCSLAAAGVSAVIVILVLRSKANAAQASATAERATLLERVRARDDQLADLRLRAERSAAESDVLRTRNTGLDREVAQLTAQLDQERGLAAEKVKLLAEAEARFKDAFESLSAAALKSNNESFMTLAQTQFGRLHLLSQADLEQRQQAISALVQPISASLAAVDSRIADVEKGRIDSHATLTEHLRGMQEMQTRLQGETSNLVKALRAPTVRGRWGEIQLKRVVEIAGMLEHCDFTQQETVDTDLGKRRPDMVVKLPSGRCVAVDSKVPLSHYLEALEAPDEETRLTALRGHAAQVRRHLTELSGKAYQEHIQPSPEFVVLFLPGETFFSAALEQDPSLIEFGAEQKVILATPTTLIALLKAVAYGWRQEQLADNARAISENGRILYDRTRVLAMHMMKIGKGLDRAVDSYNQAVGSLERSVLPAARRFKDLRAAAGDDIPVLGGVEKMPRSVAIAELTISDPASMIEDGRADVAAD